MNLPNSLSAALTGVLSLLRELAIPGWLQGILQALIGGLIGAYIGPWFHTKFQDRSRARREHFEHLRMQVFRPLREELERLYVPLLQAKLGPVVCEDLLVPIEGSITQPPTTWERGLGQRRTYAEPSLPGFQTPPPPSSISPELYDDAKRYHYRELLRRLESFKAEVERYTAEWRVYAENLAQVIADGSGLPWLKRPPMSSDASWIDAYALAVYVVDWQLAIARHPPFRDSDGRSLSISGRTVVQAPTREAVDSVYTLLDELCHERRRVGDLRRQAEPLEQQAASLLHDLNELLFSSKLPGRCPLTKV